MTRIDLVRGKNGLIAIYKDGELAATQDKFCRAADLETCIEQHGGGKGAKVVESEGDFAKFEDIPKTHKATGGVQRKAPTYKCEHCKDRQGGCEKCGE